MSRAVELLTVAGEDLEQAKDWYRRCHPYLETDLVLHIDETLARIALNPLAFVRVKGEFRHAFVHRFPYRIVYRMAADIIVVVAILHTSRKPHTWLGRDH